MSLSLGRCALLLALHAGPTPAAEPAFNAESATEAYMARLTPEAKARSDAYFEGGYWLQLWGTVIPVGLAWLLLRTRLSARMRDFAERRTRFKFLQTALYSIQLITLMSVLLAPWTWYSEFLREHQYGLLNETFLEWLGDQAKGFAADAVVGTLAVTALYAVVRRTANSWWLWGTGVALIVMAFVLTIAPVFITPLFNRYKPLPDSALKGQILSLARANGIPASDVYEFDASKQSNRTSANVTGLLGTTRISLNDNLMNRGTPEEILAVVGHEMGHYLLHHVYKVFLFLGLVVALGFAFLNWSFQRVRARFGAQWGIRDVADPAALPLLAALFVLFLLAMTPVINTIVRSQEAEADLFALNASRQPDGLAQAALHLSEYRKMRPGPVEEVLFYDHPSGWNRIHRAMVWKAER